MLEKMFERAHSPSLVVLPDSSHSVLSAFKPAAGVDRRIKPLYCAHTGSQQNNATITKHAALRDQPTKQRALTCLKFACTGPFEMYVSVDTAHVPGDSCG